MKLTFCLCLVFLAVLSARAIPAPGRGKSAMRGLVGGHFRRADKNKDRFVDSNEYWALYQRMDKNGDQAISEAEYVGHLGSISRLRRFMTSEQVTATAKALFSKVDSNRDGSITRADVNVSFNRMDANNDGKLTRVEFATPLIQTFHRARAAARGSRPS